MVRGRGGMGDSINSAMRGGGINRVRGDGRRGRWTSEAGHGGGRGGRLDERLSEFGNSKV